MILFRPAKLKDAEGIHELATNSGYGMTTLPKDIILLKERITLSVDSFNKQISQPESGYYLFVLEDIKTKKIIGTSAIEAITGADKPFYSYKLSKCTQISSSLSIRSEHEILTLVNDNEGCTELCTLFLDPNYRVNGYGLLLSRARFLFMALHLNRFRPKVIAEMRGVSDEVGTSPFWENVGRHFFHIDFVEADKLTLLTDKQFIADLMPRNPLYVELLTKEAQAVIGKPHDNTVSAVSLLEKEGFRYNNYLDIFDAGPTIEAPLDKIYSITHSQTLTIDNISDEVSSNRFIIANTALDFRATIGHLIMNANKGTCVICKNTASLLQVKVGEKLRITPLKAPKPYLSHEEL